MERSSVLNKNWGVDIGGTTTIIGYLVPGGFTCVSTIPTDPAGSPSGLISRIHGLISETDTRPCSLGVGVAGFVERNKGLLVSSPNLPGWDSFNLRHALEDVFLCPVHLDNDSNVFAIREISLGIIPRNGLWLLITLGTGIGGTIISNGNILYGEGFAGEFGHMSIDAGGVPCLCGSNGCWERYAASEALVSYFLKAGGDPESAKPRDIAHLADSSDGSALNAFAEFGRWIGIGIGNLAMCFDPSGVLLAGGLSETYRHFAEYAMLEYRRRCSREWKVDVISSSSYGGAEGAAIMGRDRSL